MKTIGKGLHLILTDPPKGYEQMTKMAVAERLPFVQLRYKGDDDREFLTLAHALRAITRGTRTKLIINDRVDIALMSHADGVHLGQNDVPPEEARAVLGEAMIIGFSTHNLHQVLRAQSQPVDYIGFGPVYWPFSKAKHDPVAGVERLKAAVARSHVPVTAIGGITRKRLDELIGIPFRNIACIGALASAEEPAAEMRAIQATFVAAL
jgi:thiamine-phosphate pyrophosphorylase